MPLGIVHRTEKDSKKNMAGFNFTLINHYTTMNSITAIIDARAPQQAIENLQMHCDVFLFQSRNITYDAISGHPDIFLFQGTNALIVAPNAPQYFLHFLQSKRLSVTIGETPVGKELADSTAYNCIETKTHFFHKQGYTDKSILQNLNKPLIQLPQAYTRCSMFALNQQAFFTSDKGIESVLVREGFDCFYVNPSTIALPPYKHGFIGGCLGLWNNTLFVIGNLDTIENNTALRCFIQQQSIEIIELSDGSLYDGGGIFFV